MRLGAWVRAQSKTTIALGVILASPAIGMAAIAAEALVRARLGDEMFQPPTRIYARPLVLYPGMTLDRARVEGHLQRLGYRRVSRGAVDIGEYHKSSRRWIIGRPARPGRGGHHPSGAERAHQRPGGPPPKAAALCHPRARAHPDARAPRQRGSRRRGSTFLRARGARYQADCGSRACQPPCAAHRPRGEHDHPATCQEPLPLAQALAHQKTSRDGDGADPRAPLQQGRYARSRSTVWGGQRNSISARM